jgi:hypothetical protein
MSLCSVFRLSLCDFKCRLSWMFQKRNKNHRRASIREWLHFLPGSGILRERQYVCRPGEKNHRILFRLHCVRFRKTKYCLATSSTRSAQGVLALELKCHTQLRACMRACVLAFPQSVQWTEIQFTLFVRFEYPEDEGGTFLRKAGIHLHYYTPSQHRRPQSAYFMMIISIMCCCNVMLGSQSSAPLMSCYKCQQHTAHWFRFNQKCHNILIDQYVNEDGRLWLLPQWCGTPLNFYVTARRNSPQDKLTGYFFKIT